MRNRKLCVKIAKDVIAQIRQNRYIVETGTYINFDVNSQYINNDGDIENDANEVFQEADIIAKSTESFKKVFKVNKGIKCEVCALGATFVSMINVKNQCSVADTVIINTYSMKEKLAKIFGWYNLSLMETAFEGDIFNYDVYGNMNEGSIPLNIIDAAISYGSRYPKNSVRLRAIMLNVIRNSGDFILPKKLISKYTVLA